MNRRTLLATGVAAGAFKAIGEKTFAVDEPGRGRLILVDDQDPSYGSSPIPGGVLTMVRPTGSVNDFNPASFAMDYQVAASYLDPLLRPDDATMAPMPWLAESWDVSDDGLQVTYRLRDGVTWHNGTPFTADDVIFSFDVYRDDLRSSAGNFMASYVSADAPDPGTVVVRLDANDPTWLFNASSLPMMSKAQYGEYWMSRPTGFRTLAGFDWNASLPDGTGPWMVNGWGDSGVTLQRNATYWGTPPHMEQLEIRWEQSQAARERAWENGEADILWPVRAADLDRLGRRRGRLYAANAASVMFLAFNFDHRYSAIPDVFYDVRTRQALSLAIDRAAIGNTVFGGFAQSFAAGIVSQPWAHDPSIESPDRNVAAARELLAEAGWVDYNGDGFLERADGNGLALSILVESTASPELQRALARVKLNWQSIGVNVFIQIEPPAAFRTRWTKTRNYDLIAYAFDQFPGFSDFDLYGSGWDVRRNLFGWNPGGYRNPAADAAIDDYLAATRIEEQQAALFAMQRAVDEDLAGIWLGFPQDLVLVGSDVLGFKPSMAWQTTNTSGLWRVEEGNS
jgi:peptide/nickel transport system substrate-binding protein